jgi:probable F420-dependent oxidoreductase
LTAALKVGVAMLYTDQTSVPVTDVARALDERGFDSLWFGEHSHVPVGSVPEEMAMAGLARLCDPFVLMAAGIAVTTNLRFGTSICLVAEHEPLGLAHLVATLDHVSSGRVELGVGYGHNQAEMRNRGVDIPNRRDVLRERVLAMKELWTKDVASFSGEHVNFTDSWSWPKPVQRPHPPIHLGVHGPRSLNHLVEFCDGWLPNLVAISPDELTELRGKIDNEAERAGRDPRSISTTAVVPAMSLSSEAFNPFWKPDAEDFRQHSITAADMERLIGLGIDRVLVNLDFSGPAAVGPVLDHLASQIPR